MGAAAIRAVRAVDYVNAGTVERMNKYVVDVSGRVTRRGERFRKLGDREAEARLVAQLRADPSLLPNAIRELLRFDRGGIAAGELWRLLTGHFVHLGVSHTLLNLAGLLLVWVLVGAACTWRQWLLVMAASMTAR